LDKSSSVCQLLKSAIGKLGNRLSYNNSRE
jgi:hypothetical protein